MASAAGFECLRSRRRMLRAYLGSMLGSLSPEQFLERHWQRTPLVIRGAAPGFRSPLTRDEIAGLACEEDVESRLVQGRLGGQWSERFDPALDPRAELRILSNFSAEHEFVAEPGDILYLPPNVAHYGVAEGEAMTFSIGFRAPDQRELMIALADELATRADATL